MQRMWKLFTSKKGNQKEEERTQKKENQEEVEIDAAHMWNAEKMKHLKITIW